MVARTAGGGPRPTAWLYAFVLSVVSAAIIGIVVLI
jgi:hypothetical protein